MGAAESRLNRRDSLELDGEVPAQVADKVVAGSGVANLSLLLLLESSF
jgi:hypothetical protein